MLIVQCNHTHCTSEITVIFLESDHMIPAVVCVCSTECGPSEASARVSCGEGGAVGTHFQL